MWSETNDMSQHEKLHVAGFWNFEVSLHMNWKIKLCANGYSWLDMPNTWLHTLRTVHIRPVLNLRVWVEPDSSNLKSCRWWGNSCTLDIWSQNTPGFEIKTMWKWLHTLRTVSHSTCSKSQTLILRVLVCNSLHDASLFCFCSQHTWWFELNIDPFLFIYDYILNIERYILQ